MDPKNKKTLLPNLKFEDIEKTVVKVGTAMDDLYEISMMMVEWIHSQPHLPKARECYYKYCGFTGRVTFRKKMSIARAKEFLDTFYTLKILAPEYLLNRDPANQQFRASLEHFHFAPMPYHTDATTRVYAGKIVDKVFAPHMMTDWNKFVMMVADIQQWDDVCLGELIVMDMGNATMQHVATLTPAVIKKLVVCYLKGLLFKPLCFHFVNVPTYAEMAFNFMKSLLKPKIANRFFVHTKEGYGTLHEHISPKYLPKDFGGEGPPLKDMHDAWLEKVDSYREWFLEQDNYVVQEELRPGKPVTHSDIFGMEGSFRKLTVD